MTATATDATPRSQMVSRRCGTGLSGSSDALGESPVLDSQDILAQDVSSIATGY